MTRRRIVLLIFLVLLLALSYAGPSIYEYFVREQFSGALAQAIKTAAASNDPNATVDFAKLPGPAWDTLHIFGPYTSVETVDKQLGFPWPGRSDDVPRTSDSENLILFVKGRTVVLSVFFGRDRGDFSAEAVNRAYKPAEAVFTVAKEQGRPTLHPRKREP